MKRILGEVSKAVVEQWGLEEHKNKKIVMYHDRKEHSKEKHQNDFETESRFHLVMDSLEEIVKKPDYVYYNKATNGLEYYKNINGEVVVAVRISYGRELKVRSVYPVSKIKIINRKKKEEEEKLAPLIEKYRYKEKAH